MKAGYYQQRFDRFQHYLENRREAHMRTIAFHEVVTYLWKVILMLHDKTREEIAKSGTAQDDIDTATREQLQKTLEKLCKEPYDLA